MSDDRRVFLSYRRDETKWAAGRIADRIGLERVFFDVATMQGGADFKLAIRQEAQRCAVLVAVIGRQWLTATDREGRRRLDDREDVVALEIGTALRHGVDVVPVLVDAADMPGLGALPDALKGLAGRHAIRVDHESFAADIERLLAVVERALRTTPPSVPSPVPDLPDAGADRLPGRDLIDELTFVGRAQPWGNRPSPRQLYNVATALRQDEQAVGAMLLTLSVTTTCTVVVTDRVLYLAHPEQPRPWTALWQAFPQEFHRSQHLIAVPLDDLEGDLEWREKQAVVLLWGRPEVVFRVSTPAGVAMINELLAAARVR